MTIRVKIEGVKLDSQTGKADEITVLQCIVALFQGSQTYLESLFSPELVTWVQQQIKDDLCADIWSCRQEDYRENCLLKNELAAKEKVYNEQYATLMDKVNDLFGKANGKCLEEIEQLQKKLQFAQVNFDNEHNHHRQAIDEIADLHQQIEDFKSAAVADRLRVEGLEMQIMRLKAEIYDLRTPHEDV
jgi:chromosome segregation ATPase